MNRLTKGRALIGKFLPDSIVRIDKTQAGTSDFTLTIDQCKTGFLKLAGSPGGPFNVIFSHEIINSYVIWNASDQTATLKCHSGATVAFVSGSMGIIYSNGVGVYALTGSTGTTVTLDGVQTLTNKTLTAPVLNSPVLNIVDDQIVALGTTTATAATKITMEFDKITTGIAQTMKGSVAVPQVLNVNPGNDIICDTINILHSAGSGDCNNLYGNYTKVAISGTGDAGTNLVGVAPRAYVEGIAGTTVVGEVYACQPWAKKNGTGNVTAMSALSALVDVNADNFTATTVNAGHFHIEGGATVVGQYDGVMVEAYPDVRSMDSLLALAADTGAVTAAFIRTSGDAVSLLNIAAANTFAVVGGASMTHEAQSSASAGYLVIKIAGTAYQIPLFAST